MTKKTTLQDMMKLYPNVSIRKLALEAGITYTLMLKASKKPIPGEAYDPDKINYDAIEKMFDKRKIDYSILPWPAMNESNRKSNATLSKDINDFEVGCKVYLRDDNEHPYTVVYKTETHIVIINENSTEPRALSHKTFLTVGGPSFTKRVAKAEAEVVTEEA